MTGSSCPVLDDVFLLLSEVVTNAVTHSDSSRAPIGMVTVQIARIGTAVQVEVADAGSSTTTPAVRAPNPGRRQPRNGVVPADRTRAPRRGQNVTAPSTPALNAARSPRMGRSW
ncbi:ATP-binding protein [Nonomuraea sp. AD125B]|uniref:ATP-binding protein n=1 Tax=Nonomuraea sp. AD125B TaxID=3242897 RepID=UPI003528620B